MNLLTPELRERLLANGRERDVDHVPVVKFFNPFGAGVWLASELDPDGDILFGLADLGYPELGSFSLEELASIRLPFGMGIERDILFQTETPVSTWAEAARRAGSIRGAGNDVDLAPGDLYWFKAAQGAIHNEAPRPGARTHALQVFVNLAEENRHDAPSAFHLAAKDIPKLPGDRATARLVLGESNGVAGAAAPDIPLTLLDIEIQAGGRFTHQGDSRHHAWILGVKGTSTVSWNESTAELTTGKAIAFAGAIDISFFSAQGAHVVLFRGPPLRQAFVQRGPFAMGNAAELDAVEADYRAGRLGSID